MEIKKNQNGRWLIFPFLFLLIIFWIIPLFQGLLMSFKVDFPQENQEYDLLYNYSRILNDKNFYKALINNTKYTFGTIICILPLALIFAFILKNIAQTKIRYFYLFCLLLPGLIPPSLMGILFNLTFNGKMGILNQLFVMPFGFQPIQWLKDPNFIMPALILQAVWRWTGFVTLFFLCALETVPKNTIEAAIMDGAGKFKIFYAIELPLIKNIILFCIAFLIVDTLSLFAGSYSLLGNSGGTANAGLVIANYSYSFTSFHQYNLASTVCLLVLPLLMILTSIVCYRRGYR